MPGGRQHVDCSGDRNWGSLADRVTIGTGRDSWERYGGEAVGISKANGFAVTACQRIGLALFSAAVHGADRMDHVLCPKVAAGCDHGPAGGQAADLADDLAAFREDGGASSAVDGAVDATSAEQRRIGGVDDRVGGFLRDVGRPNDLDNLFGVEEKPHVD